MANRQTLENLRGEIAFRRKLAVQHTTGQMLLPGYYDKASHDDILRERIETTRATFESLRGRGVNFARFVELGAERCHRSLVLCNQFGASGIAMDLSLDQLLTAGHFARLFGLPELPMRVCCDAGNLPLRSGVAPFVFCYQFLHHFPSLDGVLG
ncbi:MAG: class I SAM-dependent methyltransferase, partial [Terrimicrobiaceae bacterium]|nr:class I SAM-dependent methyltransferase [Terrimicrobiaceae bacterium]